MVCGVWCVVCVCVCVGVCVCVCLCVCVFVCVCGVCVCGVCVCVVCVCVFPWYLCFFPCENHYKGWEIWVISMKLGVFFLPFKPFGT